MKYESKCCSARIYYKFGFPHCYKCGCICTEVEAEDDGDKERKQRKDRRQELVKVLNRRDR